MSLRSWATPLTVGSFLLIAVTGVLMFFHLETGLNKLVHEWLGWALVLGVAAHLWLNWRAFTTYFKRPGAVAIMAAGGVLLLTSFVPVGATGGAVPIRAVLSGLAEAPISTLAEVVGKDTGQVLAALGASYPDATADQSLTDLAGGNAEAAVGLLGQVFTGETPE